MKKIVSCITALIASFLLSFGACADAVTDELVPVLKKGVESYSEYIDVTNIVYKYGWDKDKTVDMLTCAYLYCPELFFANNQIFLYYVPGESYTAKMSYTVPASELAEARRRLDAAAEAAVAGISAGMPDVEKALYVHDYLILNSHYDTTYKGYDAYDCLVSHSAVCQGYSLAYKYILTEYLGIDCTVVYSKSQNHAWNYVKLDGKWYHVDVTNDDALSVYKNASYDNHGFAMHENFIMSDALCRSSSPLHRNWTVVGSYPAASDTSYDNAFWRYVYTPVVTDGSLCYYAVKSDSDAADGTKYTNICSYDFGTGVNKLLARVKARWYARRSASGGSESEYGKASYSRVWMSLAGSGRKLYFNTNKTVFSFDLDTKAVKKLYTLDRGENQIFGLTYSDGAIRVAYRYDITYPEKYITLRLRSAAQTGI
ncbi:MAG: hypothetical protein IJT87_05695 [Ruminiclostridium sp.]|nr:hypothetical protein [Ruminiclostridium sp.]